MTSRTKIQTPGEYMKLGVWYALVFVLNHAGGTPRGADGTRGNTAAASARGAEDPTAIPARGWWQIVRSVYDDINRNRVLAVAAGVTFYALLAIFPAVTALVSIYGLFADPSTIQEQLASLSSIMPGGALDLLGEQVKRIASKGSSTLGFAFVSGLAIAIWSANAGMKAMFDALNVAYGEAESRNFVKLNAVSLSFTAGMVAFVVLAMGAFVAAPALRSFVDLGQAMDLLIWIGRWPVLIAVLVFALAMLYRFGPARKKPKWKWITPGSFVAGVGWIIASAGFSYYAANFGSYNETYGTLGAAIGFMTWTWISVIVIMVGAEINAETEEQAKGKPPGEPKGGAAART